MTTPTRTVMPLLHLQNLFAGDGYPTRLQRQFIRVPADVVSIRLRFPPVDAPLMAIDPMNKYRLFELPLAIPSKKEPLSGKQNTVVDVTFKDNTTVEHIVDLIPAPHQILFEESKNAPSITNSPDVNNSASLLANEMIDTHLESVNEIHFPERDSNRDRPCKAEGLAIVSWPECRSIFTERSDDDEAKMRLIVRIATECEQLVEDLCNRPRRILRRIRRLVCVEHAQQLDSACIRWIVRQPGRTLIEKAGPKRQVMSIIRTDNADTPENRVLRDFLERCQRAASQYLAEHQYLTNLNRQSRRVDLVHRFLLKITRLLQLSEIGEIPRLSGLAQPNYVLQFDDRYSRIWLWYERLRRHQTELDNVWRWQHRLWAERCILSIFAALDDIQYEATGTNTRAFVRIEQLNGQFIDSRSPIGMWIDPRSPERNGILAIRGEFLPCIKTIISDIPEQTLASDLFLARVDRFNHQVSRQLMTISCCFDPDAWAHIGEIRSAINQSCDSVASDGRPTPVLHYIIIPAPINSEPTIEFCDNRKKTALVTLPINFIHSIEGATAMLKQWFGGCH